MGATFVDLSNFENFVFPKNLFEFESKFPLVGSKLLIEISVKNPDRAYIPCTKHFG